MDIADNENVTYARARAIFISELPLQPQTQAELDMEVQVLTRIGRYTMDRWVLEEKTMAELGLAGKGFSRPVRKVVDLCSGLHFHTLGRESDQRLLDYNMRHAQLVPVTQIDRRATMFAQNVAQHVGDFIERKRMDCPKWLEFILTEGLKGIIAATAVVLVGILISLMSPHYREEAFKVAAAFFAEPVEPKVGENKVDAKPGAKVAAPGPAAEAASGTPGPKD